MFLPDETIFFSVFASKPTSEKLQEVNACSRLLRSKFSSQTFAKPHVGLVTSRIDRLTSRGVRTADGEERDADVVVFATGFDAGESLCPFPVRGR